MSANASLVLTKRISRPNLPYSGKENHNRERFQRIVECQRAKEYDHAYTRWWDSIHQLAGVILAAEFTVSGRMIVGIGAENVLENSISLHRLWGTPIIPGSALKGLVRHYCGSLPPGSLQEDHTLDLFGSLEISGALRWLDAWYVPRDDETPIALDVLTVHHPDYYGDGSTPPSDFDDPTPIPFVSARGTYLVAVQAPDKAWATFTMELIIAALRDWGVGAKTNAGYGRLTFDAFVSPWKIEEEAKADAEREAAVEAQEAAAAIEELLARIEGHQGEITPSVAAGWFEGWKALSSDATKLQAGKRIVERWRERESVYNLLVHGKPGSTKAKDQPKPYARELVAWLDAHPEVAE